MEVLENIPKGASVLDIGCGNGFLAKLVAEVKKAKVTCCDVANYNTSNLPTILYDGEHLPFRDRKFDIVILSYVLHHSQIPIDLLREAARVCRGKIIIYEDEIPLVRNLAAKAHGRAYNFFYNQNGRVTYCSPKEWEEMFKRNNLVIESRKEEWGIGSLLIPFKKEIFVLANKSRYG
jgi:ubiquinone/menaquinone biosynthesis C-methylase UbiE